MQTETETKGNQTKPPTTRTRTINEGGQEMDC